MEHTQGDASPVLPFQAMPVALKTCKARLSILSTNSPLLFFFVAYHITHLLLLLLFLQHFQTLSLRSGGPIQQRTHRYYRRLHGALVKLTSPAETRRPRCPAGRQAAQCRLPCRTPQSSGTPSRSLFGGHPKLRSLPAREQQQQQDIERRPRRHAKYSVVHMVHGNQNRHQLKEMLL